MSFTCTCLVREAAYTDSRSYRDKQDHLAVIMMSATVAPQDMYNTAPNKLSLTHVCFEIVCSQHNGEQKPLQECAQAGVSQ